MTFITNENSELICRLQNIKKSDKYINFKKSVFRTSSIVRDKLNISYNYSLEDENINYLVTTFMEMCTNVEHLIESLEKFKLNGLSFINNNKQVTESFQVLFIKEEYENIFDIASFNDPADTTKIEEKTIVIGNHHDQTLAIRKAILSAKNPNSKLCLEKDFNIEHYLENGHEPAVKEFHKVFEYFDSAVIAPLAQLHDNVFKKFKLAIKHREFLIMDYNRYKEKFEHLESKELLSDLNILQEKNYKYFMRKLDDATLEYNIATETIRNDMNHFLNHLFPTFWKIWIEKYYYTVFSLSYVLYENIANCQEINRFSCDLGDYVTCYEGKANNEINLRIKDEYKKSMKVFQRITKKKSTLNYLLG